jgi:hypothetical protein
MSAVILKWPDHETAQAWRTARRKRIGRIEPSAVHWLGGKPVDVEPSWMKARRKAEARKLERKKIAAKVAKQKKKKLRPTKSEYMEQLRRNNYRRGSEK